VSRDLDELGAVKVRGVDGRLAYRLRADLATHGRDRAEATLRQFVTDVTHSGNLAVLRTPPPAPSRSPRRSTSAASTT
jgi:transcriptional regulator of arginine metabolism